MLSNLRTMLVLLFLAIGSVNAREIDWGGVSGDISFSVPESVYSYMKKTSKKGGEKYVINSAINPFYLRADMNGDGRLDYIVFVINMTNNKSGLLVCVAKERCSILFSGVPVKAVAAPPGPAFDDLGVNGLGIDVWHVYEGGKIYQHPEALPPPRPMGEVLYLAKMETEGMFVLWNGKEYVLY